LKRIMVDRYRARPGIDVRLAAAGDLDWGRPKVSERDIWDMCKKHRLKLETAF
jgi:hypothetical protein